MLLFGSVSLLQSLVVLASLGSQHGVIAAPYLQPRLADGLALTPPMGWNSYNYYACFGNESVLMSNAKALVDLGLDKLGYAYVTPDCGWAAEDRLANGSLTWDTSNYPSGFIVLGEFIHKLGLKFGVYSDAGVRMCSDGQVNNGSLFHEDMDASTFASWGADLLKYDNCYSEVSAGYPDADYTPIDSPSARYANMTQAIAATGREILFSICEWGVDFPSLWAPQLGNTWRITNDIIPAWRTIFRQVNQFVPSASFAGPGQWPDLDLLEVGNNVFTEPEEQTHFSLWAICKSPLMISTLLNDKYGSVSASSLAILKNKHIVSYNQDSLGKAANLTRRYSDAGYDIWSGPLSGDRTVVAVVNWADQESQIEFNLPDVGLQMAESVYDVWNHKQVNNLLTSYSTKVMAHGTTVLELGGTGPAGHYPAAQFSNTKSESSTTTFTHIYGITQSSFYPVTITFASPATKKMTISVKSSAGTKATQVTLMKGAQSVTANVTLSPGGANTLKIKAGDNQITSLDIASPPSVFYDASQFALAGDSDFVTCAAGYCLPTGTKVGYITRDGTATLSIPNTSSGADPATKYVEVTYCQNDVAIATSWTDGRNARNITLQVNGGAVARLEAPLSGTVSELFGYDHGYSSCATLGMDVSNFGVVSGGMDSVVVSNNDGGLGVSYYGADMVGLRIYG